ncbi:MAG: formyl transferase [Nitrospira sp.]|nr:MAG: formyl transferase [Nitrospira sp.]
MIVLASDYVGFKVLEFLFQRGEQVAFVVKDPADRGGYNERIEQLCLSSNQRGVLVDAGQLKNDELLERVAHTRPRIGILAWWPHILKGPIRSIPQLGWLNLHPSYLPFNRGKHPNFWCLAEGTPCGVSLHFIDEGVDTGDIVAQARLDISWEDTGETVYRKCRELILQLFTEKFDDIFANRLPRLKQAPEIGSFHTASEIEEASRINVDAMYTASKLFNIIRARMFALHPTAYFHDGGKKYSVQIMIKEIKDLTNEGV